MSGEMSRLAAALGLCLAVAGSLAMGAEHTFDGDYFGKRVLAKVPIQNVLQWMMYLLASTPKR